MYIIRRIDKDGVYYINCMRGLTHEPRDARTYITPEVAAIEICELIEDSDDAYATFSLVDLELSDDVIDELVNI